MSVTERGVQPGHPLAELDRQISKFLTRPRVYSQHQWWWWLAVAIFVGFVPQIWGGGYYNNIEINALLDMLLALGFYLQFALAGQFSFATPAFYAIGAFTFAWSVPSIGFLLAFFFAIVVTAAIGLLVKVLLVRSPLIHFAIATLALANLAVLLFEHVLTSITGGDQGRFNIPTPSIFGYQFDSQTRQYYLMAGVLIIVLALLILYERSPAQRDVVFIRDMGPVARTTGLRVNRSQAVAFCAGAGIMGAAGSLLAATAGFVSIGGGTGGSFAFQIALYVLLYVLLGGIGIVWGPLLGVIALYVLPQRFLSTSLLNYEDLIYAIAILVVILILPGGLSSLPTEIRMRVARFRAHRARP